MRKRIVAAIASVVLFAGCSDFFSYDVELEVSGTAEEVDIWWSRSGSISTITGASLPWSMALSVPSGEGEWVSVSVQNTGEEGRVVARVLVDNVVEDEATGEGPYALASAEASL